MITGQYVASTFVAGNSFAPGGGGFLNSSPASPDLRVPIGAEAGSPFVAGFPAVIWNPTGGTITVNLSPDNVTFGGTGYTAIAVLADTFANVTLPNYMYASAAGAYLLGT